MLKLLLARGADATLRDGHGLSPIHVAVKTGRVEAVRTLLDHNSTLVDLPTEVYELTPLHVAAEVGSSPAIARLLLQHGADVEARTSSTAEPAPVIIMRVHSSAELVPRPATEFHLAFTPLLMAAASGNLTLVRLLVEEAKADLRAGDVRNASAIHVASERGHAEVVDYLLGRDPYLILLYTHHHSTALHYAVRSNSTSVAKILLEDYAFVDWKERVHGETPLHVAATASTLEMVELLLSHGASCRKRRRGDGATPLHAAVDTPRGADIVARLISFCGVDSRLHDGQTALHTAIQQNNSVIAKLLVGPGNASVDLEDADGRTALELAAEMDSSDAVLLHSLSLHARHYPLQRAISRNLTEAALQRLISSSPELVFQASPSSEENHSDSNKTASPLITAVKAGRPAIVKLLLNAGARSDEIDQSSNDHQSAIHEAVMRNDTTIVRLLLADVDKADRHDVATVLNGAGLTPLLLARKIGANKDIIKLLTDAEK